MRRCSLTLVLVMRFAELPAGGVSVRGWWVHWEDLRLYLPESPDNAKLKTAVPELAWNVDAHGVYSIHFDYAVELFSDLLDVPTVKDPTCTGVWRFWERVPGPLAMWRAWLLVRYRMSECDWAPNTAAGFAGRLVALKADVPDAVLSRMASTCSARTSFSSMRTSTLP